MDKTQNKRYDLEGRTLAFAKQSWAFVRKLPRSVDNIEDGQQLIRASGSVGANYIEANESLSKKDFRMRIKICRKEAKECAYWLKLIDVGNDAALAKKCKALTEEATELMMIFSAIMRKTE